MSEAQPAKVGRPAWPALQGGLLALLAAVLHGAGTPFVQRFGAGVGQFSTAALLYAGAAVLGFSSRRPPEREARVRGRDGARLAWVALFGAAIAPTALAFGLQRTSAVSASLTLSLEAVFTAGFARLLHRESLGRRARLALLLLVVGAMALALDSAQDGPIRALGLAAIVIATFAWGIDNALSRPLSIRDPGRVAAWKGVLGAALTGSMAFLVREPLPEPGSALGLLAVGATGYGLSLRYYLLAQRSIGAARTGSLFAMAPLVGALAAIVLGERPGGVWMGMGGLAMAAGILLQLSEQHAHPHRHEALDHEHAHSHDDGHHLHVHGPAVVGSHSHRHVHAPIEHDHPHVSDEHHAHAHDRDR